LRIAHRNSVLLSQAGDWNAEGDLKLAALLKLLTKNHPQEKVIGQSEDPTRYAWRFSPESNQRKPSKSGRVGAYR
jgi:hypothetical protein